MRKYLWIIIGIILLAIIFVVVRGQEDNWIKGNNGVWVKHGNPKDTPAEVTEQQNIIAKAQELYQNAKANGQDLSSGPCLGSVQSDWIVDIVHSPRQSVDDQPVNQCADYLSGKAHHFIELDTNGNIIRIE